MDNNFEAIALQVGKTDKNTLWTVAVPSFCRLARKTGFSQVLGARKGFKLASPCGLSGSVKWSGASEVTEGRAPFNLLEPSERPTGEVTTLVEVNICAVRRAKISSDVWTYQLDHVDEIVSIPESIRSADYQLDFVIQGFNSGIR